jgi:hypothetical protein
MIRINLNDKVTVTESTGVRKIKQLHQVMYDYGKDLGAPTFVPVISPYIELDHNDASNPDDIRADGWLVVCHNDYRQDGVLMTFWSFAKGRQYCCADGVTDADALSKIRNKIGISQT